MKTPASRVTFFLTVLSMVVLPVWSQTEIQEGERLVAGWMVRVAIDPIDDRRMLTASRASLADEGDAANLMIGCVQTPRRSTRAGLSTEGVSYDSKLRLLIEWDVDLGTGSFDRVDLRLDDGAGTALSMYAYRRLTLASGKRLVQFTAGLMQARRLTVRIYPEDRASEVAVFDVTGLTEASESVRNACAPQLGDLLGER